MKIKELIKELEQYDPELEVKTDTKALTNSTYT